ncbi:MAG: bifunctional folylpolyglutamate synthase/dihydrofolate synthase [Sulfurovum sp.]
MNLLQMLSNNLNEFLSNKPLYYKEIDHKRVHIAYGILKPHIKRPQTIHIVGTNGKGSTGRIVAHLALSSQISVGHFSSPHISKFNERIWLNGADASDEILEEAHKRLFDILDKQMSEALSYFEYTTLLSLVVFEECDLIVLEAGLGGEFDATNVCDKELSIITPIGIDHQAFLGDSITEIASTKIRSIQKKILLAPQIYREVEEVAEKIVNEKNAKLYTSQSIHKDRLKEIATKKGWAEFLITNAQVATTALDILNINYDIESINSLELFGRFYLLRDKIRIDVGHNPLASQEIVKALNKKVVLIYNSLDDKDYQEVLRILKPKIKRVEIIKIESQRATTLDEIEKALKSLDIEYSYFDNQINSKEDYLVFGSFYVVEEFLDKILDNKAVAVE